MTFEFSEKVSDALYWLERQTHIRTNHARMLCGRDVGSLMAGIIAENGYKNVLEIGVFTGFSSICLAAGTDGGHVDALEINDELTDLILDGYERAGFKDAITLHIGDALKIIPILKSQIDNDLQPLYDVVYLDANKRFYSDYYDAVFPMLRQGGMIIADNVLWSGKAQDPNAKLDAQTRGIKDFNSRIEADPRVEAKLLDLRDGVYLIKKL